MFRLYNDVDLVFCYTQCYYHACTSRKLRNISARVFPVQRIGLSPHVTGQVGTEKRMDGLDHLHTVIKLYR